LGRHHETANIFYSAILYNSCALYHFVVFLCRNRARPPDEENDKFAYPVHAQLLAYAGEEKSSLMSMILRIEQARQAEARTAWAKGELVVGAY
jgi:hypothetical protein